MGTYVPAGTSISVGTGRVRAPAPDRAAHARPPASAPADDPAALGARIAALEAATRALIDEIRAARA